MAVSKDGPQYRFVIPGTSRDGSRPTEARCPFVNGQSGRPMAATGWLLSTPLLACSLGQDANETPTRREPASTS